MANSKLAGFIGQRFESSSGRTPQFTAFSRAYRNHLKAELSDGYEITDFNTGHFYISAFLRNLATGKLAYLSVSDVRHFPEEWHENVLVRVAQSAKDYIGGANNYCKLSGLRASLDRLTG